MITIKLAQSSIVQPRLSGVYERKLPDYSRYRARLAVRGAEGNVVDASATPSIVRSNKASVIAIAEKEADILIGNDCAVEESRAWRES